MFIKAGANMALKWKKDYKDDNWIYINNPGNSARYVLGVKGKHPLIVFGINPSTASDKEPDATLVRVEKLAEKKLYDSWIMLNLYPFRDKNVKKLKNYDNTLHTENLKQIGEILDQYPDSQIIAAWGNIENKLVSSIKQDIKNCLKDINDVIEKKGRKWLALKDDGFPVHFLYTGSGFKLYEVDFVNYKPSC
jgi:hypothetical protein